MTQIRKKAVRKKHKAANAGISLKHIYSAIVALVLLISLGSWLFSSKPSRPSDADPVEYKSALKRFGEITLELKNETLSNEETDELKRHQRILMKISGYETYLPYSVIYDKAQFVLADNPETISIHEELVGFSARARENLSQTIDSPTDANLLATVQYMRSMKSEINRLVRLVDNAPESLAPRIRNKIVSNLEKLVLVIDSTKAN